MTDLERLVSFYAYWRVIIIQRDNANQIAAMANKNAMLATTISHSKYRDCEKMISQSYSKKDMLPQWKRTMDLDKLLNNRQAELAENTKKGIVDRQN